MAVHCLGYLCGEVVTLLRDDVGCGFLQCEEIWAYVLYFLHCTWAEEVVFVCIQLVTYMSHGGRVEEVRVIVATLRGDGSGYECCKDGDHLLLMVADHPLECLGVPPCCRMVAAHVRVIDGSCV